MQRTRHTGPVALAVLVAAALEVPASRAQDTCWHGYLTMVPMRDGVQLKTRVTLPEGTGPWPVLMLRTPNYEDNLCNAIMTEPGYVMVAQNVRGFRGSEGVRNTLLNDGWGERQDGYDTVQWILAQPWCNGRIGFWGGSVRGALLNLAAGADPPGVEAEWLWMAPAEFYKSGVIYYGGALRHNEFLDWFSTLGEDLYDLTLAHPAYDEFWQSLDATTRQHLRDRPVHMFSGWYDVFLQSTIDNFVTLRQSGGPNAREHSKLIIMLKGHGDNAGDVTWTITWRPPAYDHVAFFNRYLKDVPNGAENLPRVYYMMMGDFEDPSAPGNEWRWADDWPPPALNTPVYFHGDRSLRVSPPGPHATAFVYEFDPDDPVPTLGGAVHGLPLGSFDQRPVESRHDVILFETGVLQVPVEVAGPVTVRLWASSDCVDTDFTAKLTDVYPDGRSIILCDGIIRARARNSLAEHELMTPGVIYPFEISLWATAVAFNRGHRIRVAISSSNFPRFDVNPNTGAPLALEYAEKRVARNTVYCDPAHPSHILLPLVGPDSDGDGVFDWLDAFPADLGEHADDDGDGMGDNFEQRIVDHNPNDAVDSIDDVLPDGDFDGDGQTNLEEFLNGTDPASGASRLPLLTAHMLAALVVGLAAAGVFRTRKGLRRA